MKVFAAILLIASSAVAADEPAKRTVQIRGTGTVSAAPDRASFVAGVETHSLSLKEAFADNKRIVQAVLKAMRDRDVSDAQIRTANFSIQVVTDPDNRERRGYLVSNAVTVTRDKTDDIASLVEAAVDAGANNVNSISYWIADTASLRDQALDRAYADAKARAAHLAAAAGKTLGDPLDMTTEVFAMPQPVTEAITVTGPPSLELQGGMRAVTTTILVTFELK